MPNAKNSEKNEIFSPLLASNPLRMGTRTSPAETVLMQRGSLVFISKTHQGRMWVTSAFFSPLITNAFGELCVGRGCFLSPQVPRARALYTYRGHNPGELRFNKGDTIALLRQLDENWYLGELNGISGVFPASSVQVIKHLPLPRPLYTPATPAWPPRAARKPSPPTGPLSRYGSGSAQSCTQSSMQPWQKRLGAGSSCSGRGGSIPQPSWDAPGSLHGAALPPLTASLRRCVALHSYTAQAPDELELQKGEGVRVFGKDQDGWLRGMSLVTGRVGLFPGNYVTPLFRSGMSS
uniref:SH3 domain-containing protein n=1 Tax=Cyanistes caeruleus TaxID=156563 RepID=A0A8C0U781_CYACU